MTPLQIRGISLPTLGLLFVLIATPVFAQAPSFLRAFHGQSNGDEMGSSVAPAGDVNADGFDDVISGAPGGEYAKIFSGRYIARREGPHVLHVFRADANRITDDDFGRSVAGVQDIDQDGHDDVVVGSPLSDVNGPSAGAAFVYSGRTGTLLQVLHGFGRSFGASVCGPGDVNGDHIPDVMVAAPVDVDHPTYRAGKIFVYSGAEIASQHPYQPIAPLFTVVGDGEYDLLGTAISGAGDVNGDGCADLLLGAPQYNPLDPSEVTAGYVKVVSGRTGSLLMKVQIPGAGRLGYSVSALGDCDFDGLDDFLIGAPHSGSALLPDSGAAYVISGGTLLSGGSLVALQTINGTDAGQILGRALSGIGDVDNNGMPDFAVTGQDSSGKAYFQIFSGDGNLVKEIRPFRSGGTSLLKLGAAGDVDGDSIADFMIGAPESQANGFLSGSIGVFSGSSKVELSLSQTVIAGEEFDVFITGAPPGSQVEIVVSQRTGSDSLANCFPLGLSLHAPRQAASSFADDAGNLSFRLFMSRSRANQELFFQAYLPQACEVTNRVSVLVE